MTFQQEYYDLSLMETSLSNEIFDYFQNVVVSGSDDVTPQQNPLTPLSSLPAQSSSGEEPPRKRRRRRTRNETKIEEKENQRMNHIAVERNRRRQMNHLLSILKSMMPLSYSQRSDQASIIEGTINYLKKQERILQSLQTTNTNQSPNIFSDFFFFPQYSTATASSSSSSSHHHHHERLPSVAEVEVTIAERHANIKVLTKTRPKLLFNIINAFYSLGLSTLHLNFTTCKDMSLFNFSVKVEEDCQLPTRVNEITKAVHEVVRRFDKEN